MNAHGFAKLRPYAFHTTTPTNFAAIYHWRRLRSSKSLLSGTEYETLLQSRRRETLTVIVENIAVEIRDQGPLQKGHIQFEPGFTFENLVAELNNRVFFWPGSKAGPGNRGTAHYRRYAALGETIVLRCPMRDLLTMNGEDRAYVSACNSGAPRSNPVSGYAVRGPSTFQLLHEAQIPPGKVQELSFQADALLPASTEWSRTFHGDWQLLWPAG